MTDAIRVLVAVDHLALRRRLATLLLGYHDVLLVGEARNGAEALDLCEVTHPDVVLVDLLIQDMDAVEATFAIRKRFPEIQVIVLTNWDEYDMVQRALSAGAGGYLLTNLRSEDLVGAIRVACPSKTQAQDPPQPIADLTVRELEVLGLMTRGLTNGQIGAELIISRATAKYHVSSILRKLGAVSRTEAVALAIQINLTAGPA